MSHAWSWIPSLTCTRNALETEHSRRAGSFAWLRALAAWLGILAFAAMPDPALAVTKPPPIAGKKASITVDIDEPSKPGLPGADAVPLGPERALADTVWIADWSFDSGGGCTSVGWTRYDNRILNDGSNYWVVDGRFNGQGFVVGQSAVLSRHNLCWSRDGYGNAWDYSVVLKYRGAGATLSFSYRSDGEPGGDHVTVEADSAGVSEARVNYTTNPKNGPEAYRTVLFSTDGPQLSGSVSALPLPDFGAPGTTHEVYIRFKSDLSSSDEDGLYPSALNAGLAVDNVVVTGTIAYSENFEGALNANVQLLNTAPATPFGEWARLFQHITDNDKCSENTTCAWLTTDPLRLALFADMAFGPGQAVIHSWLDDIIVSPWVSLASTPTALGTVLTFRMFPANIFNRSKIVLKWNVRGIVRIDNTDTSVPSDSLDCITTWKSSGFMTLDDFQWVTKKADLATLVPPAARNIQVSFEIVDWQYAAGDGPPASPNVGPGPYIDRVRLGRQVLSGPSLSTGVDSRTQAQDCFPTVQNASVPGEHFSPDGVNIFGSCAFSSAEDLGIRAPASPNLITGDSITVVAADARNAGGLTSVRFYGAIVRGPHAGKAPAPYTVGGNGFFSVPADTVRLASGVALADGWFVDLDDTYFRGGDGLVYFWTAEDAAAGFASLPKGLIALPSSVTQAETTTHGLFEVDFLPTINWDAGYLARIAADAHGDLEPTAGEIANSSQKNCLLYVDGVTERASGPTHRTSFMYTLDVLGYRGHYDVYDVLGSGNVNNALGGRANVAQASGYALIVFDAGDLRGSDVLPDGSSPDNTKINQAQWFRNYLAQGSSGVAGTATVWMVGENIAELRSGNPLISTDVGATFVRTDQGLSVNPDVKGVASFNFAGGGSTSFVGDKFGLAGGCPSLGSYDALGAAGTAVITHRYAAGATTGDGAIVMNRNVPLRWNAILTAFTWFDIRDAFGATPGTSAALLANKILNNVLPVGCRLSPNLTDIPPGVESVPAVTALHPCVPNPFNPTTTLHFDLAHAGRVRLSIYDAAGRRVRALADGEFPTGRHAMIWNGFDGGGRPAPSGIYFARLQADGVSDVRKLVLVR